MKISRTKMWLFGVFAVFLSSMAEGEVIPVDCTGTGTPLQNAVDIAAPGDIINVIGICNENILVRNEKQRITIDGGGTATVNGLSTGSPVFNVRGKGILIQGLTITDGSHGIHVNRGSNAVLNDNFIDHTNGNGVLIDELAFAVLTNNTIHHNPGAGIVVSENSTARIGFNSDSDTAESSNSVRNNALGVVVSNGSSARIVGNSIRNNNGSGVVVTRDSHADIADNAISGNDSDGIACRRTRQFNWAKTAGRASTNQPTEL